ncbi:AsmA family protein [Sphingomonas sp.]|uniref:AsmA family protein n=1 Tax=Sphingomonas sp. TaxID=28214 RepID=UPI003B00CAC5
MAISVGERRSVHVAAWFASIVVLLLVLLAAFPWGLVARHAAGPLSKALERPVTIGAARRTDWFSFVPAIELRDLRVAQPGWAGPGDMAHVRSLRLRLPTLPLLLGHVRPRAIQAEGVMLHLVRDANGRENWSSDRKDRRQGEGLRLADLTIAGGRVRLDDAGRHVALDATLASDRHGLRVDGSGTLRGAPLRVSLASPAIAAADPARAYPATLSLRSPLVSLTARLRMDHPLDTSHFAARIDTSGRDLVYLDDIIQAGLFRTRAFHLRGEVRHDGQDWRLPRVEATIGRSVFTASLDFTKPNGRTRLNGRIDARTLDFDDFASDEQRARAAAKQARIGPRVVPDTRIVLDKVKLDGTLKIHAARLLASGASPFRSLDGTATLDHRRLTAAPLTVGLPQGRVTGRATVDDRGATPRLTADLRVEGATVRGFFPDQQVVTGPLRARLRMAGSGATVRDALADGDGRIGFAVAGGSVRRDYATFLGGDVLKSIGAAAEGKQPRAPLDCLVASFAVSRGRMTPQPLLLSTPIARGDGAGAIVLGPETIGIRITGRPTRPGPLLSTAPVRLFGTLSHPRIDIRPPRAKDEKRDDILSRVGFFLGKLRVRGQGDAHAAAPVNCPAEIGRALR